MKESFAHKVLTSTNITNDFVHFAQRLMSHFVCCTCWVFDTSFLFGRKPWAAYVLQGFPLTYILWATSHDSQLLEVHVSWFLKLDTHVVLITYTIKCGVVIKSWRCHLFFFLLHVYLWCMFLDPHQMCTNQIFVYKTYQSLSSIDIAKICKFYIHQTDPSSSNMHYLGPI